MEAESTTSAQVPTGSVVRGTVTAAIFRAAAMLIGFLNMFLLMRILSPADFGIMDMVATLTVFLSIGGNLGLSAATVQSREVNHAQLSTLFWVNTVFGFLVWVLCTALGPAIAWFYKEPGLAYITALMGMVFFWGGLSAQSYALLQRGMRFVRMGAAEIGGQVAGMCVAVFMAWSGFRYWAVACGSLTTSAVSSLAAMALAGFWPGLPRRGTGVRAKLRYGGWLIGFNFLNYFNRNLDHIIVGRACGKEDLGFYARAYKLYLLPLTFINAVAAQVMFPVLSRMQDDRKRFAETYAGLLGLLIVTACTLAAWMGILAEEIMSLFGPQWAPAVPVFRILALAGVVQPLMSINGLVFLAAARTRALFSWAACMMPLYAAGYVLGMRWSVIGVACAHAAVTALVATPLLLWLSLRTISAGVFSVLRQTYLPWAMLLVSVCAVYLVRRACVSAETSQILRLAIALIVGVGVQSIMVWALYLPKIRLWLTNISATGAGGTSNAVKAV